MNLKPLAAALLTVQTLPALAEDAKSSASLELTGLQYQGSSLRTQLQQQKLNLGLQASPAFGLNLGLGESTVDYQSASSLKERSLSLSIGGLSATRQWSWRLGGIRLDDTQTGNPDLRTQSLQAGLGWWPTPERLLDAGYSRTRLDNGILIDQLTPMVGGSFNRQYTWLQLRGYFQQFSQPSEGLETAASAELKVTQWLDPGSAFKPRTLQAMVQGGKRLYGVDTDAGELYSLPYIQTASAWAGAGWRLGEHVDLTGLAGVSKAHSVSLADTLKTRFIYLNLSTHW